MNNGIPTHVADGQLDKEKREQKDIMQGIKD